MPRKPHDWQSLTSLHAVTIDHLDLIDQWLQATTGQAWDIEMDDDLVLYSPDGHVFVISHTTRNGWHVSTAPTIVVRYLESAIAAVAAYNSGRDLQG